MQPTENVHSILTFRRDSQHISLTPETLEKLGGDVTVRKRVPVDDFVHGYDVREVRESALAGHRMPNAGLIDLLAYRAWKRGYQLTGTSDTPISTLPEPANGDQLTYSAWAQFVQREPRGLVRISKPVDVAVLITELAVAFPSSRIMLLGRVNDLKPVYLRLRKLLPKEVHSQNQLAFVHGGCRLRQADDAEFPRLICCTPTEAADLDSEKCDIVVMYDAFECLHELMAWPLIQMDAKFRLFGILRTDRKPKPYEQARLHQVFGFSQLDLMDGGRVRRDVHYAWVRHAGQAPAGSIISTPALGGRKATESVDSLAAYVHNHHRNDQISRLAKKLRAGNPIEGDQFRDVRRWLEVRGGQSVSITVVVDRLDHAIQLQRKLGGWPIIADPEKNLHDLSKSTKRRINIRLQQWLPCQIVVADAAQNFQGQHSDVLIWASGGVAMDIPAFWTFSHNNSDRPMLIIDFLDDFTAATRKLSYQRRDDLAQRNIFRVGTSEVIGRIERFEKSVGWRR